MKPVCLVIMDGWGVNPDKTGNAVALAPTPNLSRLAREYPSTSLTTSGTAVGLPHGQMGNSEVGHLTIGAGRVVYQELTRIDKAACAGYFLKDPILNTLIDGLKKTGKALHLMGLLSDGGVHSHISHLFAIIDAVAAKGLKKLYVHAFLDGRDTPPDSGAGYMLALAAHLKKTGCGTVATVGGRYWAMDRDTRWDRVAKAYAALVRGEGNRADDPVNAVEAAYRRAETDEFIVPTVIVNGDEPVARISDGDGVFFFNFRSDRAREITEALTGPGFNSFDRGHAPALAGFVCMTEYDKKFGLPVIFKPQARGNILPDALAAAGLRQFRVSETEKYAHVTFFFNGGKEEPYPGEERLLIPSVKDVPTYDKKPAMRAIEIAEAAVAKLREGGFSFMLMNFANGDMVGHTGALEAAIEACATVDRAVGMVVDEAVKDGWAVLITSDHGNAEQMIDPATSSPQTAHTTFPVPFILVDDALRGVKLKPGGLKDIAPTVLKIMGLGKPKEMDGEALL
ncbi:MAG: 2,3-bisphosphoglycerate-independent phosphoglycerate mutase [Deltaproteobacteria bacterium]|nr:2,3-bisphosphoglycerate-independent phosphoglycerate mutase [Deltaproteobacteria bacterium]